MGQEDLLTPGSVRGFHLPEWDEGWVQMKARMNRIEQAQHGMSEGLREVQHTETEQAEKITQAAQTVESARRLQETVVWQQDELRSLKE